ncbi:TDT family transporter [Vibrio penaeicida]|uniref:C4-dicarboxylate ABC transporter n=1 Tax=Vibrio penaeicida TaxID=104609 RepID=A0AAV5NLL0_9VIBR|nr:TDT family transporter [Vibrio penaeicida]RTZ22530.1 TDT family transporter [Vibrio penaeicida]GLQ71484.1 C4-dicarboxylate ABC transporter [Vibrio penaeicida]
MIKKMTTRSALAPTPMAGLALGIASLGWSWENAANLNGMGQLIGAGIAGILLLILTVKFMSHRHLLKEDMAHPVVGSVLPTFAMALMVISHSFGQWNQGFGDAVWMAAVLMHVSFLVSFIYHRSMNFQLKHMVPSWFVPPVGLIVADVSFSGTPALAYIAEGVLNFGLVTYAILLPTMIYRLVFCESVPDAAKPTIAILAAPASLSLAGYLTVTQEPSPVLVALLFGIAILMTVVIYAAFFHLLRLPFSPAYAAFTFPMVIGATALFKMANWLESIAVSSQYVEQVRFLANIELIIASGVVGYVCWCYVRHVLPTVMISGKVAS